jgi:hypothetical protein
MHFVFTDDMLNALYYTASKREGNHEWQMEALGQKVAVAGHLQNE